jgi:hypothetical protein
MVRAEQSSSLPTRYVKPQVPRRRTVEEIRGPAHSSMAYRGLPYSVLLSPSAERELAAFDKPAQRRVVAKIEALASNPRQA